MKKLISMLFAIVLAFAVLPFQQAGAELADGKYSLPYQVNKAGTTSASISNDYFIKPATLIKKDGQMYVQVTLKNSSQFKKFEASSGGNKVVSTDAANDRRTVQFNIASTSKLQQVSVRIEIPEENYYHNYKIDFHWFADKAKLIESYAKPAATKPAAPAVDTAQQEAAKKAEAEKKAAAEKAAAEKAAKEKVAAEKAAAEKAKAEEAKKLEAEQKAQQTKQAEEAEAATKDADPTKEEAKTDEDVKETETATTEEASKQQVAPAVATTTAAEEVTETASSTTATETANTGTTDSSNDSKGSATGWIIGLIAVLLIGAGVFFLRKGKTA